jgi:N-acetylated-alpha-linked acidic dipeptidase
MDPKFEYGVALAQTAGRIVLRLADADVLPFEFSRLSTTVGRYAGEVQKLADDMRKQTEDANQRIAAKVWEAVDDPTQTWVAPKPKAPVPFLNFAPLENAVAALDKSTAAYEKASGVFAASGRALSAADRKKLDTLLLRSERALTRKEGLPRRPWYVHQIYAPGFYTGYGVKTLPAIREAIEQREWKEAGEQIVLVSRTIEGFAKEVDKATAILTGAAPDA